MKENPRWTSFLLFKQCKTPSVPYFSILDILKPRPYPFLAFSTESNLSSILFQHFQWKKIPAVPYFDFFNESKFQVEADFGFLGVLSSQTYPT